MTWAWAIATCRGTSHIRDGSECQDTSRCIAVGPDKQVLVAVVSDGAGSAAHSKRGSALTCRTISERARQHFAKSDTAPTDEEVWSWIDQARDRIGLAATSIGATLRDFAATLVCVIAMKDETLVLHVGDGAAVCKNDGQWLVPSWPAQGEYAATTYFVTDDPSADLRIVRLPYAVLDTAVFSDGIERQVLDFAAETASARFFDRFSNTVRTAGVPGNNATLNLSLKGFLDSSAITDRTDDDKSLIVAVRL